MYLFRQILAAMITCYTCGVHVGVVCGEERPSISNAAVLRMLQVLESDAVQKEIGIGPTTVMQNEKLSQQVRIAIKEEVDRQTKDNDESENASDHRPVVRADEETHGRTQSSLPRIAADASKRLKGLLTSAQYLRLQQIIWQADGIPWIVGNPDLAVSLRLTSSQIDAIQRLVRECERSKRGLLGTATYTEIVKRQKELQQTCDANVLRLLTADQKAALASLGGKPFDTSLIKNRRRTRTMPAD